MPNLRIVHDNALERAATLVASSTAGALAIANVVRADKASVWRAQGTAARLDAFWTSPEPVQAVGAICNWSPTATMRVRVSQEGSVANLLRQSEAAATTPWIVGANYFVNSNSHAAPDGAMTADSFGPKSGLTSFDTSVPRQPVAIAPGIYTASMYVKPLGATTVIRFIPRVVSSGDTVGGFATFGANPSFMPSYSAGTTEFADTPAGGIVPLADGWYRVWVTFTVKNSITLEVRAFPYLNAGTPLTGDGTSGMVQWGAMLNAGPFSSYYPSGAASGVRPAGYIDAWQSYDYDSGFVPACPAPAVKLRGFTPAQAASAYAYGGGAYARHWMPTELQARGMAVEINDPNNLQGYIEAACMVAGPVWSPQYNASDATMTSVDTSKHERTAAGTLVTEPGFIYRKVPMELSYMVPADREALAGLLRNSQAYPIFVSVFPGSSDLALERDYTVYGKRSQDSAMAIKYASAYSTTLYVEEL